MGKQWRYTHGKAAALGAWESSGATRMGKQWRYTHGKAAALHALASL
ncbi:MAG: hypothetical protein ACKVQK_16550 [Burkholderiales bacterium]